MSTLENVVAAIQEHGPIRSNPAAGLRIATALHATARTDSEEDEKAKALSEDELRRLLQHVPAEWRLIVTFVAHTGFRTGGADVAEQRLNVPRRWYPRQLRPTQEPLRPTIDATQQRDGRRTRQPPGTGTHGP